MTEAIKILTLADLIFVLLLAISGSIDGILGEITYSFVAFVVPLLIGYYASIRLKRKREEIAGIAEPYKNFFTLDSGRAKSLLPLIAPSVALVFTVSLLTSLVLSALGVSSAQVENRDILTMLVSHALAPAIFEEAVFRYLPMLLLAPYSKRVCVFYSAFCFALIHCSFAQMPYAFVAGLIFMTVDLAFGSVWPSVILHFINNAASVVWIKYCIETTPSVIFISVLLLLAVASAFFIFRKREEYSDMLRSATEKGESAEYSYPMFLLVLLCGYIAVSNLFV